MAWLVALATAAAWLWAFWLLFVAVMGLYRAWLAGRLEGGVYALAMPALAAGWLVDWLTNWTLASLWFWQWPQAPRELVTHRLTRYLLMPGNLGSADRRRRWHAELICARLLDPFDPNPAGHCTTQPILQKGDTKNG
jgi:hypothetical protein